VSVKIDGLKCVLFVDDEQMIRNAGKRILKRFGCEVLLAEDGFQALEIYRGAQTKIDVVILDMGMPMMDGTACFAALKKIDPGVKVVISSGSMDDTRYNALLSNGVKAVLPKPYDIDQLTSIFDKIFVPTPSRIGA
jgi:two-component system, cell cycle sensor histidine kinase and response regulator CckA